jgi:gamma-glutamylcyclotransferase (GGCT)/AIG2-like uncharacterized protein YtfP
MATPLFVYGTLKGRTARRRHPLLRKAKFVTGASISGELYDLGEYPGLVRPSRVAGQVRGELFEIPEDGAARVLRALDRYEGSEFVRRRVYVTLSNGKRRAAWAYLLRKKPPRSATRLYSGRYSLRRGAA